MSWEPGYDQQELCTCMASSSKTRWIENPARAANCLTSKAFQAGVTGT